MKHFARLALASLLLGALALGGCAGVSSVTGAIQSAVSVATAVRVTPQQAYVAINAFDAVEATATHVLELPLCTGRSGPVCRPAGARAEIRKLVLAGRTARNSVKAYLRANPGQSLAISSFSDLTAATDALRAIAAAYKSN